MKVTLCLSERVILQKLIRILTNYYLGLFELIAKDFIMLVKKWTRRGIRYNNEYLLIEIMKYFEIIILL